VLAGWSILESVVCRAFAGLRTLGDVSNNRGYIIYSQVRYIQQTSYAKEQEADRAVEVSTL